MHNLDEEYDLVKMVLDINHKNDIKNNWQVCFHVWRLYRYINQNIQHSSSKEVRVEILNQFMKFAKTISVEAGVMADSYDFEKEEVESVDLLGPGVPSHVQEMILLMWKERRVLGNNLRKIKREQDKKSIFKLKRCKDSKRNWV